MMGIDFEDAKKELNRRTKRVSDRDLRHVLEHQEQIERKLFGPLARYVEDVRLFFQIVQDYYKGEYREIPWGSVAAIVATLLYILIPVDLIPDPIPVLGQMDDAMVVYACLMMVDSDLQAYKAWKERRIDRKISG